MFRFTSNIIRDKKDKFDNIQTFIDFNVQIKGVERNPSIAKMNFLQAVQKLPTELISEVSVIQNEQKGLRNKMW